MRSIGSLRSMPAFLQQSEEDISNKFEELKRRQKDRTDESDETADGFSVSDSEYARLPPGVCAKRNRYKKTMAFAHNRILLEVASGENDYINASPIWLGKRKYIAAQGPKEGTVNHFYRMVVGLGGGPVDVVMLTKTHDGEAERCFPYFPISTSESPTDIPVDQDFRDGFQGSVTLEDLTDDRGSQSEIRHLGLRTSRNGEDVHETDILHYWFRAWPDHGAPEGESEAALVRLIRMTASRNSRSSRGPNFVQKGTQRMLQHQPNGIEARQSPLVVHCSAGVGRTGTFIALDYLLSLLDAGDFDNLPSEKDPMFDTVDSLRRQRMTMVERVEQFAFIYKVLRDEWQARRE